MQSLWFPLKFQNNGKLGILDIFRNYTNIDSDRNYIHVSSDEKLFNMLLCIPDAEPLVTNVAIKWY